MTNAFRQYVRKHNSKVLLIALLTCVTSLLLWLVLYFIYSWIVLLAVTSWLGIHAEMPRHSGIVFCGLVILLFGMAIAIDCKDPGWRFRDVRHLLMKGIADAILLPPRLVFAVPGTLRAYLPPGSRRIGKAWNIFHFICQNQKVPVRHLGGEFGEPQATSRLLLSLQLLDLIEIRKSSEGWVAMPAGKDAKRLGAPQIKLR